MEAQSEPEVDNTITLLEDAPDMPYPKEKPRISLYYLSRFSTPHTLKWIGYIKQKKIIVLIYNGITHNFIH